MIHRNHKTENFVILDKTALNDSGLSWAAKGMHAYLMGLPKEWRLNLEDLKNRSLSGKHATTSAMDELIEAGYVVRRKIKNGSLFSGYEYQVFQDVADAEDWKSKNGFSVVGKPDYGKSEHGESDYGKPRTNKNTGTKELIKVSIEEVSIEEAPAHEWPQGVAPEVMPTLIHPQGVEITGPDATKSKKPKKAKNGETMLSDVYTREGFIEAWNWTPFAKARVSTVDAGRLYDRMEAWCSSKPATNKRTDWLAAGRTFVLNAERDGKPGEFAPQKQTIVQQMEAEGVVLTEGQKKLVDIAETQRRANIAHREKMAALFGTPNNQQA